MAFDPTNMSLPELREWVAKRDGVVSPQALKKIGRDPRRGVRQLYLSLRKRAGEEKSRRLHLDALLNFERVLWRTGVRWIAGVDEVGVGPLAGPVVAAAVVFPPDVEIDGVDDSKKLDRPTRERLAVEILEKAEGVAIGSAEVEEIDRINIYQAALQAMRRAVEALPMVPQHVLVDARQVPGLPMPQNPFNKGDGINFSIAAASIVAKVHRDRLMVELDAQYPVYGFARHKGYCTAEHQEAVRRHGPCPVHRQSYAFLHELCGEASPAYYELQQKIASAIDERDLAALLREIGERRATLPELERKKLEAALDRRWGAVAAAR